MPPAPKPASRRQGRHRADLGVVVGGASLVPPPPSGVLKATGDEWAAFWASEAAALVLPADLPALERMFSLRDERRRCQKAAATEGRLVMGSTGQPVLNPLYKHIGALDSEIRQLEDRFGLSPMARLKLGVVFGDAKRSLADLDDDEDTPDDRFSIIDTTASG